MDPAQRANVEILQELEARPFNGGPGGTVISFGGSTVVWRPGAASSGNVFATWAEVVAAVAALNGDITIGLDTDLAAAVVPPGNYNLRPIGFSGPVTIVNASKTPPFPAPFLTLGPGPVTIAGLSGLSDVSIDNQSTVPVIAVTKNGAFELSLRAEIFQEPGAAAFWAITVGDYTINMTDNAEITTPGGGTNVITVVAPGTLELIIQDIAVFDTNMLVAVAPQVNLWVAAGAVFLAQAGAPTIRPLRMRQTGSSPIVVGTGKTAAITVFMNATSVILVSLKTPVGDAATIKYAALAADRVVGSLTSGPLGSFKIAALSAGGGGAVNGADTSTIDWEVIN